MVNLLYAVTAFVCSLVMIILPFRMKHNLNKQDPLDRAFLMLINWTAIFCLIDCIWGVLASSMVMNDSLLFAFSSIFHLFAAFAPLLWMNYVLDYLGELKHKKLYMAVTYIFCGIEVVLITVNAANHMMFYIDETGAYCSTPLRRLLFYMQYVTYVFIAVLSTVKFISGKAAAAAGGPGRKITQKSYLYVILFVAAPILAGIFQMIYPDAPAYSIGYMLGCCIIYTFVVTDMLSERMLEKAVIEASRKAKTEFLFNMSHDIRTPMNAITGFTSMAKKHLDEPDKLNEYLDKIDTSGQQLLTLINEVLEMSRIESGKIELEESPVDIRREFDSMVTVLAEQAKASGLDFRPSLCDIVHPCIYADRARMSSITLNIAGNAMKYTPRGGRIDFILKEIPGQPEGLARYIFTVEDTGIGMSAEYLKVLYEPFSREKSSTVSKIQGTGLGMSIVRKLVDLMGGDIQVRSEPGKGTRFDITVDFRIDTEAETQEDEPVSGSDSFEGCRVLLTEDNDFNREIATDLLTEAGFIVESTDDGTGAVGLLKEKGPEYYDFILMDIQMPVMGGYEATEIIRKMYPLSHVPIIALSANAFAEDKAASLAAGMDDHVAKPINIAELMGTIAKLKG